MQIAACTQKLQSSTKDHGSTSYLLKETMDLYYDESTIWDDYYKAFSALLQSAQYRDLILEIAQGLTEEGRLNEIIQNSISDNIL